MGRDIRFSSTKPKGDRVHWVTEEDVRVVLSRLPPETYRRLRAVHLNDMGGGVRQLGYVTKGRREIALCALPPRVSLTRYLDRGQSPKTYGARRNAQWPPLAIRRFMLYDVFLHELGHLQVVDESRKDERHRFAREAKAEEFAALWRGRFMKEQFDHPDPVHRGPSAEEIAALED
jgi:hypothetical protein